VTRDGLEELSGSSFGLVVEFQVNCVLSVTSIAYVPFRLVSTKRRELKTPLYEVLGIGGIRSSPLF